MQLGRSWHFLRLCYTSSSRRGIDRANRLLPGRRPKTFPSPLRESRLDSPSFRGKVVVLNFWASWCGSCVEEMPDLDRLQTRIRSRGGIVLAVSVDENCGNYEDFLKKFPVRFSTSCEPTNKVSLDYGTVKIPETYIIDREGRIVRRVIGPQQWDSAAMNAYFDAILAAS